MSVIKTGASAFGKLFMVAALAAAFVAGMAGVVYMSLQGEEMKVPEITGKDFVESEKELAALGLRIKKRADRYSAEKPNTILEQLPRPGDTVKTGQMILVVTSKTNPEGEEAPAVIKKNGEDEDDSEEIKDLISDKPKKSNKTNQNTNSNKKKAATTRDVIKDKSNGNSNSDGSSNSTNKNSNTSGNTANKLNKEASTNTNGKLAPASNTNKTASNKPAAVEGARPQKTPKP